jgi:GNAT superfamily N-acetyltransferase
MTVKIRRLEDEDIDGIMVLWKEFARLREDMTHRKILNEDAADYFFGYATGLLQRKDTLTLVAEDETSHQIVAYLIASKQRKPPIYHHTRVGYLSDAFVADTHRGQGILHQFIERLIKWCEEEGITAIDVMLFRENELAQQVYEKMGFEPYRVVLRRELEE